MGDANATAGNGRSAAGARVPYTVEVLREVRISASGLLHGTGAGERLLRWEQVRYAIAAEVGEPEGVRTIVFDLVLGSDGDGWRVARIDADPGPAALAIAQAIHAGVGPQERGPSIKSLASDGVASWWHADLESFAEAAAAAIPRRAR